MKDYPLDVCNVGDDTYCLMSKGHHDFKLFMDKIKEEGYSWSMGNPEHVWIKSTPDRTGNFKCRYSIVDKGTRGAWPATYTWESYGEDMYVY